MNKVNLKELYLLQADLDKEIAINHNVSYESTFERRLLALIIELGELANETRCFKYWSNKGPSPKEIVMDEYADGLHFLLSLGIPLKVSKQEYELHKSSDDLTHQFHLMYEKALALREHYDESHYLDAMQYYLNLALSINMSSEEIISSYKKKLSVNHKRQETNY